MCVQISGWVPVAPVGSSQPPSFYSSLSVPTMIVYGEYDRGATRGAQRMALMPNSTQPQVLPKSGNAIIKFILSINK